MNAAANIGCNQTCEARSEADVMSTWKERGAPVVSVCCATFNHARYIEDALKGFFAQVTEFPFEIIIRDDASTDGTSEIIREYALRYPNIVRAVIETENQFNSGIRSMHLWPSLATGEFVALCEGDDFWIDPLKLQKQVELLQKYPEAVMSVAKSNYCKQSGESLQIVCTFEGSNKALQDFEDIHRYYLHTSTYVARKEIFDTVVNNYFAGHCLFGDTAFRAIMITHGPFAYLPEIVSVYRQTGDGIWSSLGEEKQLLWEYNAAQKLSSMLKGMHAKHQKMLAHNSLQRLYRFRIDNRRFMDAVKLLPMLIWYRYYVRP